MVGWHQAAARRATGARRAIRIMAYRYLGSFAGLWASAGGLRVRWSRREVAQHIEPDLGNKGKVICIQIYASRDTPVYACSWWLICNLIIRTCVTCTCDWLGAHLESELRNFIVVYLSGSLPAIQFTQGDLI